MKKENKKIIITAGGTGGHVFPAIAIANYLHENGYDILFITDKRAIHYFKNNINKNIAVKTCLSKTISGNVFKKLKGVFFTSIGCIQAFFYLLNFFPKKVIAFGGYASFPAAVASVLLRRPLILHEQNAILGKTNRILAKFANVIALSFKDTKLLPTNKKTVYTGYPARKEIEKYLDKKPHSSKDINVLVIGGSQGARIFNSLSYVFADLDEGIRNKIFITQQVADFEAAKEVEKLYKKTEIKCEIKPFFQDVFDKIHQSNLIISRSGAGNCFEAAAMNKKAIFVPLGISLDNDQEFNARSFEPFDYIVIKEKDFNFENAKKIIEPLLKNPSTLKLTKPYKIEVDTKKTFLELVRK
ncbi:MAG: UDP-N-acetylglucosamine--N-acetylmuramyl-(pentapeptide) pyrophosphoryl-undecaprenol N-acetylglucosamine transferase [Rickettsiales bacterium]|jgi:UDP-N-acetylglucosamine--N-acetylmuramyl-(pentapeptide) pyrophosphoryl-undecaprenol N-acetylglucosamine transferase|nr:UDP-N-acetylglucosamine--N-acetylmuramyl-(pentapeptide) pyrophosphoryl-undecaprenol N-acetylglucosamine transferase [Rickettsiales bacterium]